MPEAFDQGLTSAEIRRIAADALVLGFPLILTDTVRRIHPLGGNKLVQLPDKAGPIAPGLEDEDALTVGSSVWLDVAGGPVVVDVPPPGGGHLSIVLYDPWARPVSPLGPQRPRRALTFVAADWQGGLEEARRLPGTSAWMITRITSRSAADREACQRLLPAQVARPEGGVWPSGEALSIEPPPRSAVETALALGPATFLHRLAILLARHPPPDDATRQGFARLRVAPGALYAGLGNEPWLDEAVTLGFRDGAEQILSAAAERLAPAAGWKTLNSPPIEADPISRAATAAASLGAPALDDVLTLVCAADASGQPLRGSERYTLRFPPGGEPPVQAFWSLSLRAPHRSRDLAANRPSVGDREALTSNPDGALDVLIQHSPPAADRLTNWLPVPPGEFTLVLRLYAPQAAALNGQWIAPPVLPFDDLQASTPSPRSQEGAKS